MDFRAEGFNIFNKAQYGDPSKLDITSGGFGVIDTSVDYNGNASDIAPGNVGSGLPRQVEFSMKLIF